MKKMIPVLVFISSMLLPVRNLYAQDISKVVISIELKNATLDEAFAKIQSLTPFKFNYKTADVAGIKGISYQQHQVPVKKVVTDLLANTSLQYEQVQQYILITKIKNHSPQHVTIYGFVKAVNSGESLIGATVSITGDKIYSSTTNAYGFYSLTVPAAETYPVYCSYVGFKDFEQKTNAQQTHQNNIDMATKECALLQPITVSSVTRKNIVKRVATGNHTLSITGLKKIAMAGGEPDVLKSLQLLPGIQTSAEGTTNLSVRGGSYDQNLILLDEATVYNPTHSLGFFSAFNSDALKDVSIYKGVFPAQYGGRLSSVIDIRMKEGNNKERSVTGGIGLLAGRLTWEGPVKKERSSFMVSGRYSNIGALLNLSHVSNMIKFNSEDSKVAFYDLNAKFNTKLGSKDRLYLSAYTGHDVFYMHLIDKWNQMKWGNSTFAARWNHVFNASLFANTSLLYSHYNYSYSSFRDSRDFTWRAYLQEITGKTDFDWVINSNNHVKFGAGITMQDVLPGKVVPNKDNTASRFVSLNNRSSTQLFAYINNEQKISRRLHVSYGVRATGFAALGDAMVYRYNEDRSEAIDSTWYGKGKIVKSYFAAEPRVTSALLFSNTASVKISYARNYQFQHLLTNSSVGLPTDLWMPSDSYFKPQYADQLAAGIYKTFANEMIEASVEAWYRKSHNVLDFKDNADVFMNNKIETQVLTGQAKGYGVEWLLKKNKGWWNGWVSYTWSKSLRQIDGINNNEWYPPSYDHRHNVSIVYNCAITKRLSFSTNWIYRSGGRTTVPEGSYLFDDVQFFYYGKRNGYTLPANHRLDVSIVWHEKLRKKRKWQGEWNLSVYNVYNRHNVFALYINQNIYDYSYAKASQITLAGILPTITYNFKF
jgi:hypothetical protein